MPQHFPAPAARRPTDLQTFFAFLCLVWAYAWGWGFGVYNAFVLLLNSDTPTVGPPWWFDVTGVIVFSATALCLVRRSVPPRPLPQPVLFRHPSTWPLGFVLVIIAYLGISGTTQYLGNTVQDLFLNTAPSFNYTDTTSPTAVTGEITHGIIQGAIEEPFFTLTIVLVLTRCIPNIRPWTILIISVILRALFHVYYGLPYTVANILPWATAAVLLYYATHHLIALAVAHAVNNFLAFTPHYYPAAFDGWLNAFTTITNILGSVCAVTILTLWIRRRRALQRNTTTPTQTQFST